MSVKENYPKIDSFLDDVRDSYNALRPSASWEDPNRAQKKFVGKRVSALSNHYFHKALKHDETKVVMSEWLALLCLKNIVSPFEMIVHMAPVHLEAGSPNRKGVDLVIFKSNYEPLIGVNVKLGGNRNPSYCEDFWYDNLLCTPAINTSLGRWKVKTWEKDDHNIRGFIEDIALPQVALSGKIPHLWQLEKYIFENIFGTVKCFKRIVDENLELNNLCDLRKVSPESKEEFMIFYERLNTVDSVLDAIQQKSSYS